MAQPLFADQNAYGRHNVATVIAAYTVSASDSIVRGDTGAATYAITLPDAVANFGKQFTIIRVTADATNFPTIATTSSQTISGATTLILPFQYSFITVVSNGANWTVVATNIKTLINENVKTVTAAYTALETDSVILCDTTSGAYSVTLPDAATNPGKSFTLKRTTATANLPTVATAAGNIDGAATYTGLSAQYKYVTVISNGTQYFITASN